MRRWLRSACKWGGAALTVLLLVVWVGSAWWRFGVFLLPTVALTADSGEYCVGWLEPWSPIPELRELEWTCSRATNSTFAWGFDFDRGPIQTEHLAVMAYAPGWFVVLLAGLPTAWLWRRGPRRSPGLCAVCGYDLRGAAHAKCPECGAASELAEAAA